MNAEVAMVFPAIVLFSISLVLTGVSLWVGGKLAPWFLKEGFEPPTVRSYFLDLNAEMDMTRGRVVTAPTNGAAGIVPAVLHYYGRWVPGADDDGAVRFLLAAGAWTADLQRALRCTQELRSGYVWINNYNPTPVEVPFGGVKSSGFGRDCGPQAIDTYTTWKTVLWSLAPFEDWYKQ